MQATAKEREEALAREKARRDSQQRVRLTDEQLEEIHSIFDLYDTDGDGRLSRTEIVVSMVQSGYDTEHVEALFDEADKDESGTLDTEEFVALMQAMYV